MDLYNGQIETEEFHKLILEYQKDFDKDKIERIIISLIPMTVTQANKYSKNEQHKEDLVLIALGMIEDLVLKWRADKKCKFTSYYCQYILWEFGKEKLRNFNYDMRRERDGEYNIDEDECRISKKTINDLNHRDRLKYLHELIDRLDVDEKRVITYYYLDGIKSDIVIADLCDKSSTWTQYTRQNGLRNLRYEYLRDETGNTSEGIIEIIPQQKNKRTWRKTVSDTRGCTKALRIECTKKQLIVERVGAVDDIITYKFYKKNEKHPEIYNIELQVDITAYHRKYIPHLVETAMYHLDKENKKMKKLIDKHIDGDFQITKQEKSEIKN